MLYKAIIEDHIKAKSAVCQSRIHNTSTTRKQNGGYKHFFDYFTHFGPFSSSLYPLNPFAFEKPLNSDMKFMLSKLILTKSVRNLETFLIWHWYAQFHIGRMKLERPLVPQYCSIAMYKLNL